MKTDSGTGGGIRLGGREETLSGVDERDRDTTRELGTRCDVGLTRCYV